MNALLKFYAIYLSSYFKHKLIAIIFLDIIGAKLPPVPEELTTENLYKTNWNYDYDLIGATANLPVSNIYNICVKHWKC